MRSTPTPVRSASTRRFPLLSVLRPHRPSEIWFKHAWSVVIATAIPDVVLLTLGRTDLIAYTMAGSFCALYAHDRPYATRARTLAWVVVGMVASLGICLVTASLTRQAMILVTVGALLAAVQKTLCDAARIGPPAHVIYVFISSAALFFPQRLDQVPGHLALTAVAGLIAWCVGMAPALVRPHGPERRAVAAALDAAGGYATTRGTRAGHEAARGAAVAAVHRAWESLAACGTRNPERRALELLVVRAEVALAAPDASEPRWLRARARQLRRGGPVPRPAEIAGIPAPHIHGLDAGTGAARRSPWRAFAPGSPALPLALRTFVGCALAGGGALALGVDRPYWALVTAAALYQANTSLTWSRTVQRVVGNLAGVLIFAAVAPLAHLGPAGLIGCCLVFAFGAEALISRAYWLGTICVTPMALLVTEFARPAPVTELMTGRIMDTLIGAVLGFAAALAVADRRAGVRTARPDRLRGRRRRRTPRARRTGAGPRRSGEGPPPAHRGPGGPARRGPHRRRRMVAAYLARTGAGGRRRPRRTPYARPDRATAGTARLAGRRTVRLGGCTGMTAGNGSAATDDTVAAVVRQWHEVLPDLDTAPMEIIGRINRCAALLQQAEDAPLRRAGLTRAEFDLLNALRRTGHELTPGELARETFASGAGVTKRLKLLTERGLVGRRGDSRDRRVALVTLTDDGRDLVDALLPAQLSYEEGVLAGLDPAGREELGKRLGELLTRLEGSLGGPRL